MTLSANYMARREKANLRDGILVALEPYAARASDGGPDFEGLTVHELAAVLDVTWHRVAGALVFMQGSGLVSRAQRRWTGPRGGKHRVSVWQTRAGA